MAVINVRSNKNIEFVDLEVHAIMCEQRRLALEEKITEVAEKLKEFEKHDKANKKLMLGAIVSIITGLISTVISVALHLTMK